MQMTELTPDMLTRVPPRDRYELHAWLRLMLGIDVPPVPRCCDHASPLDYLDHVFFERPGNAVVWANRGGGKTYYGAVATLLDMLFKPGIEIRILGGSFNQSDRMYEYLRDMLERPGLREMVARRATRQGVRLVNGSRVELLAQVQTSVRGQRVQKLRCDEVDLFLPEVWQAAQFVTRSKQCGNVAVRGSIECFSTMHRSFGLMHELVSMAAGAMEHEAPSYKLFPWCVLDVMSRCDRSGPCELCPLFQWCEGHAREGRGFVPVQDVIEQQVFSSHAYFNSEMLCRKPSLRHLVYPMFDEQRHVKAVKPREDGAWIGGMDFGVRSPFVMLWAQAIPRGDGDWCIHVIDEYVQADRTVDEHMAAMTARDWPRVDWVACDPAGGARNEHTGISSIALVERSGYRVRAARSKITHGIEWVRRYLQPADGTAPRLTIHPRCRELIRALGTYHFDPEQHDREIPMKDGPDHTADALRYMLVNLQQPTGKVKRRDW